MGFDRAEYLRSDNVGKAAVIAFLQSIGYEPVINPEPQIDITAKGQTNGVPFHIEAEVKRDWIGDFKYTDVHIPARKGRHKANQPSFIMVVSGDSKKAFLFPTQYLRDERIVNKRVRNNREPENFYSVLVEDCMLVSIPDHSAREMIESATRKLIS